MHTRLIFICKRKKGETGKQRGRHRESVRECERCGKTDFGIRHKTVHWKNPLTSFWDKLGRINFFWETILMGEWDRKDTLRLNIFKKCA
jgi:hypothetical protein